jgi:ubiquitin carboxyl-terminal hydrolase 34
MNVPFRGFLLGANVADSSSQKLLYETQQLFANMQDTWQKFVSPHEVTDAITTYDNERIDVTVQMDVDEFYNLLFDRWEGQMLSADAKKTFRSFYGGQLVQQVKSKECDHISEREEPFSAIQCDIKGKSCLQESLQAYVEGEIMEGDNKYSCTSCGRHVNAVKRTCLKDIPDNLIFHLKRFDFDLRTLTRSKINDMFQFPLELDMKPYTVEHLSDPEKTVGEDMFRLVGVLVHSGTAESGHYYSFIRERPSTLSANTWVEFNDADVSPFDPETIGAQCFGGSETYSQSKDTVPITFPKPYSAYMLFYERVSSLEDLQATYATAGTPVKVQVPTALHNSCYEDNETFIRKHCLYDPNHIPFLKSLGESWSLINKGMCTEDHEVEKVYIHSVLDHLDQIIQRTKEIPDFDITMQWIKKTVARCVECCDLVLEWFAERHDSLRNMLMKNPIKVGDIEGYVRRMTADVVLYALKQMREHDPTRYGLELTSTDPIDWQNNWGTFHYLLNRLNGCWEYLHLHFKAWDEYFGLLTEIARMGVPESVELLHRGILRKCLELLVIEWDSRSTRDHQSIIRMLEKGRKPSYYKLIELISVLLTRIDLRDVQMPQDDNERYSYPNSEMYPLTKQESRIIHLYITKTKTTVFVTKMLDLNINPMATNAIIARLLQASSELSILPYLHKTVMASIAIEPANLAAPYLRACVTFCQNCPQGAEIKDVIYRTAQDVDTIGIFGGRDHVSFFHQLTRTVNPYLRNPNFVRNCVLDAVPQWAPPLLTYHDISVREEAQNLIDELLFSVTDESGPNYVERLNNVGRLLGERGISYVNGRFLESRTPTQDAKALDNISEVLADCKRFFAADLDSYTMRLERKFSTT